MIHLYAQEPVRDGHWLRNLNLHHKMEGFKVVVSGIKKSWNYMSVLVDIFHDGKILGIINTWDPPSHIISLLVLITPRTFYQFESVIPLNHTN